MPEKTESALSLTLEQLSKEFEAWCDSVEAQDTESWPEGVREATLLIEGNELKSMNDSVARRDRMSLFIEMLESHAKFIRQRVKSAEALARSYEAKANRLKWSIQTYMELNEIKRVEGYESAFQLRKCPASLVIDSEADVPAEFKVKTYSETINKDLLKMALEKGPVPGAHLVTNKKTLELK